MKYEVDRLVCWLDCLAQVFVTDLGKEYGGWPLNDMERSYKFMLRHVRLWKVAFHGTSPRWVHGMYLAALAYYYAKYAQFHGPCAALNALPDHTNSEHHCCCCCCCIC